MKYYIWVSFKWRPKVKYMGYSSHFQTVFWGILGFLNRKIRKDKQASLKDRLPLKLPVFPPHNVLPLGSVDLSFRRLNLLGHWTGPVIKPSYVSHWIQLHSQNPLSILRTCSCFLTDQWCDRNGEFPESGTVSLGKNAYGTGPPCWIRLLLVLLLVRLHKIGGAKNR